MRYLPKPCFAVLFLFMALLPTGWSYAQAPSVSGGGIVIVEVIDGFSAIQQEVYNWPPSSHPEFEIRVPFGSTAVEVTQSNGQVLLRRSLSGVSALDLSGIPPQPLSIRFICGGKI